MTPAAFLPAVDDHLWRSTLFAAAAALLDRTGLTGEYDFEVDFAPFDSRLPDAAGPSIFTAVQEQLRMRLESTRAPAEVIVIDGAEKPAEN
jgi:uncharacterized protein (TIGR03435 family)